MSTIKQTPLTLELFQEILIPQIKLLISETVEKKLEYKLETKLKEKLSYLPTKKEYYAREDKTMNELKKIREDLAATQDLYKKTNKRVDIIDEHLGIATSNVF